jgi:hypothetical protein
LDTKNVLGRLERAVMDPSVAIPVQIEHWFAEFLDLSEQFFTEKAMILGSGEGMSQYHNAVDLVRRVFNLTLQPIDVMLLPSRPFFGIMNAASDEIEADEQDPTML